MSEFFNVTLVKDILIDDTAINKDMTWSSDKIIKEIIDKRITKFEELYDVDVTNRKDKQVVAYSEETGKFITVDGSNVGNGGGNVNLKQVSKMGINGSKDNPTIIELPISTMDFKVPKVNILKYDLGQIDISVTKSDFAVSEKDEYIEDEYIEFDGKAKLKTKNRINYKERNVLHNGAEYKYSIDFKQFKKHISIDENEEKMLPYLNFNAIPKDRLLVVKNDFNLSNVNNIDFFKLEGKGDKIKVVCSSDSGKTWKTFDGMKWANISELTFDEVMKNGMSIDKFNNLNSIFWNDIATTKKIRFAYTFSMNDLSDVQELDNLILQYDGTGNWIEAKDNEYDVVYSSNSVLEVRIKFKGDIKINY